MHDKSAITWFEIPTANLMRATAFYEAILATRLKQEKMDEMTMSVFEHGQQGVGGCLVHHPTYQPSPQGTVPYLNAGASLDAVLSRVAKSGGKVALPKTALPDGLGFFAQILDTEGNRVGLHALQ